MSSYDSFPTSPAKREDQTSAPTRKPIGCSVCCSVSFLLVAALGAAAVFMIPTIVRDQIADLMPIKNPTSILYQSWQDTEVARLGITRSFYFFNVTNPHEVVDFHQPPNFVPIGPFVFKEHTFIPQDDINWRPDASIAFKYQTTMTFVPELSKDEKTGEMLTLDHRATVVNFPMYNSMWRLDKLMSEIYEMTPEAERGLPDVIDDAVCEVMHNKLGKTAIGNTSIFINRTVQEYIFGYEEPIWVAQYEQRAIFANATSGRGYAVPTFFQGVFNGSQPAPSPASRRYGQACPMWNQSQCNTSISQYSVVESGQTWTLAAETDINGGVEVGAKQTHGDLKKLNQFKAWAGNDRMWWWGDEDNGRCQEFEGSNGLNLWPGITKDDEPHVFFDAIFRKLQLKFKREVQVGKLKALRFEMSDLEKYAGPQNKCYNQMYDGLLNMTAPVWSPLYISNPFFYNTPVGRDQMNLEIKDRQLSLINITMEGISMKEWQEQHDREDFETYLAVEPHTGATAEAAGFLQPVTMMNTLNLARCNPKYPNGLMADILGPKNFTYKGSRYTNDLFPETMVPFFYMKRHAKIPDDMNNRLYNQVIIPLHAAKVGGLALVGLGLVVSLFFALRTMCRVRVSKKEDYQSHMDEHGCVDERTRLNHSSLSQQAIVDANNFESEERLIGENADQQSV